MPDTASPDRIADESWRELTTLERLLLRYDRQGDGMVFRVNLHFDGHLEVDRLCEAVEAALRSHPLLRSTINSDSLWQPWTDKARISCCDCDHLDPSITRPISQISIEHQPGVEVHLARSKDHQSLLSFDFHHASTDGQGGGQFARDVLREYFDQRMRIKKSLEPADPSKLSRRGAAAGKSSVEPLSAREKVRDFWATVRGRNVRLDTHAAAFDAGIPLLATTFLSEEETAIIHEEIRRRNHTLNDFALTASFSAIASVARFPKPTDYVSVMNPVNLRGWDDRRMSAANRFGFAFVRRRITELGHPKSLLESVADQMRYVRGRLVSKEFMEGFALAEKIPGLLTAVERSGRFSATANFTCMSNSSPGRRLGLRQVNGVWTHEGVSMRRVSGYGPLPPQTPLSLALCDSGSIISLNVRGRPGQVSLGQLQQVCQNWRSSLLELAGTESQRVNVRPNLGLR